MDLDESLQNARPPIATRSAALLDDLSELATATREATRAERPRRVRPTVVASLAGVALLGVAGSAAAAGFISFDWTSDTGRACSIIEATAVMASGVDNESKDGFARTTAAEREQTLQAAQTFLTGYDFDAVDVEDAIAVFQAEESAVIATQPDPAERAPRLVGDELEVTSLLREQARDLVAHLEQQGYRSDVITLQQGYSGEALPTGEWRCPE